MAIEVQSKVWPRAALREICDRISSGGTPSRARPEYFVSDGHLWVKSKELPDGSIYTTEETISDDALDNSSARIYPEDTILIAMYGATVGQLGILRRKAAVNQAICALVVNRQIADYRYVFYALLHTRRDLVSKAFGAAQQNLNQDLIKCFEIPIPPLPIQRKIAAILSAYDDLIENNTRRIALLEEMARALYREWFVEFRYPGHEGVPLVDSPLGPIPQGWRVAPFTELADVFSGGTPRTSEPNYWDGEIPFFTPKDAGNSFYVSHTERAITEAGLAACNSRLFPKDTVFITARGTVGKVVLAPEGMAMSQSCYALQGRRSVPQYFVYLATLNAVAELRQNSHGAVFDTVIVDTFRLLNCIIPPVALMNQFNDVASPLFAASLNLTQSVVYLRRMRDLLLPALISGQVDVSNADSESVEH